MYDVPAILKPTEMHIFSPDHGRLRIHVSTSKSCTQLVIVRALSCPIKHVAYTQTKRLCWSKKNNKLKETYIPYRGCILLSCFVLGFTKCQVFFTKKVPGAMHCSQPCAERTLCVPPRKMTTQSRYDNCNEPGGLV